MKQSHTRSHQPPFDQMSCHLDEDSHHGRANCPKGRGDRSCLDMAAACSQAGWRAVTHPVEVGCRGYTGTSTQWLLRLLGINGSKLRKALKDLIEETEQGRFLLWIRRTRDGERRGPRTGCREWQVMEREIIQLLKERRHLWKAWRRAEDEEKEGFQILWKQIRTRLTHLRWAIRIGKRKSCKEKKSANFFWDPFKYRYTWGLLKDQLSDNQREIPFGSPGDVPLPPEPSSPMKLQQPKPAACLLWMPGGIDPGLVQVASQPGAAQTVWIPQVTQTRGKHGQPNHNTVADPVRPARTRKSEPQHRQWQCLQEKVVLRVSWRMEHESWPRPAAKIPTRDHINLPFTRCCALQSAQHL